MSASGEWRHLYCAVDKYGTPFDLFLTARRDLEVAKRFFHKMLWDQPLLSPDRIGTDAANPILLLPGPPGRQPWGAHATALHHQAPAAEDRDDHFRIKRATPRVLA